MSLRIKTSSKTEFYQILISNYKRELRHTKSKLRKDYIYSKILEFENKIKELEG